MRTEIFGQISKPVVVVVGEWDPMSHDHLRLFLRLKRHALKQNLNSLVVLIYPRPIDYVLQHPHSIYYNDINYIIEKILSLGINGVCAVRFAKRDTDSTAKKFINNLLKYVRIEELWLGSAQSFGRWKEGSYDAINDMAKANGFKIKTLRKPRSHNNRQLLENIKRGIQPFSKIDLPQGPTWKRNRKKYFDLNWKKGSYKIALSNSIIYNRKDCLIFEVEAVSLDNGLVRIIWPDKNYNWLCFLRGP